MEVKKIIIDGEEIEVALKIDKDYYQDKVIDLNLEDTLNLENV